MNRESLRGLKRVLCVAGNRGLSLVSSLANNTAGYKDFVRDDGFQKQVTEAPFRTFTREELIEFSVGGNELNFEPGTAQAYSHTEFILLREVLEKATGRSIEELYQTEVLDPLGLTRTGYQTTPELPAPVLHAFSSDRVIYEESTFWNPSWASDSGPLYSTLGDLGKWGPAFGQGRLLTPASFLQLTKRPGAAPPTGPYFATGFVVSNGWYFQNPNFNGYTGALGYNSDLDMTIAVYATQPEDPKVVHPGFEMFQGLVEEFAPNHSLGI